MTKTTFDEILKALKQGKKVCRTSWTHVRYAFLVDGSTFKVNRLPLSKIFEEGTEVTYHAHIDALYADDTVGVYTLSSDDILASNWVIIEEK